MLRNFVRRSAGVAKHGPTGGRTNALTKPTLIRSLATRSGDDTVKPTALAKIHLEDGTTLVGKSFGSHESAEGEVCISIIRERENCTDSTRVSVHNSTYVLLFSPYLCNPNSGGLRHRHGRISREHDRSIISRTNLDIDDADGWQLRCSGQENDG